MRRRCTVELVVGLLLDCAGTSIHGFLAGHSISSVIVILLALDQGSEDHNETTSLIVTALLLRSFVVLAAAHLIELTHHHLAPFRVAAVTLYVRASSPKILATQQAE